MKWLFRWLDKKIQRVRGENLVNAEPISSLRKRHDIMTRHDNVISFSVARANGGYVVEYHSYDERADRSNHKLHIVTDDKDLGEELGKIISFESLRA